MIIHANERLNFADFAISQDASVLHNGITVAFDKEFGRTAFSQMPVAGMDMHGLDGAVRSKVKVISSNLIFIVFRHGWLSFQQFKIFQQITAGDMPDADGERPAVGASEADADRHSGNKNTNDDDSPVRGGRKGGID